MGNLGLQELLIIAFVALLVFGPDKLPEVARQLGRAVARLRQETSRSVAELKRAADIEQLEQELAALRRDLREVRSSVGRALTEEPAPTDPEAT